jgi:hypothetical protein
MKHLYIFVLILLCCGLVVPFIHFPTANATTITTTKTFTSLATDGYLYNENSTGSYGNVRNATSAYWIYDSQTTVRVGQYKVATLYFLDRAFLYFDCESIPDSTTITSAVLSLYIASDYSDSEFNVTVQSPSVSRPHEPLQGYDYYYGWYSVNCGSRNTDSIVGAGYWNITLNSEGLSKISWGSTHTRFVVRSYEDISNSAPTGNEYIIFDSANYGSTVAAKLYVSYTVEGFRYVIHGPFYESGAVYPYIVNLTLYRTSESPLSYLLNGAGGADTVTIDVEAKPSHFCWNTTTAMNRTRVYYLGSGSYEEIWIFVPNSDEPYYLYTFNIVDMVGVSNAYLESIINVNGANRVVERQSLSVINSVPFWMIWAHRYSLRLVCDQGSYVFGDYVALTETSNTLTITQAMFPKSYPTLNMTVQAKRMNATWIEANYTDSKSLTSWVKVDIKYKQLYSSSYTTAYSVNNTGSTSQVDWYSASSTTDYMTSFTASYNGSLLHFSFPCPSPINGTNYWTGIWDSILGQLPFPAQQLVGSVMIMCVLGIFTYFDTDFGLVVTYIIAGILTYMGWYTMSAPMWMFGFAMTILYVLSEKKKKEAREGNY